jgi:UDP-N-acetylmuramyl pentapeptide phosphotransferase/UDP-N-acetylglucosamine-1-phosphate transferase
VLHFDHMQGVLASAMFAELQSIAAYASGAAVVSAAVVALLVKLAPRIGLLDRPNGRSLHKNITPRGGGIGFVLAVAIAFCGMLMTGLASTSEVLSPALRTALEVYLCAGLFIAAVSLWDDFKSLSSGLRMFCQLGAATVSVVAIGGFEKFGLPGGQWMELGWVGAALTIVWIVGLTNVYNFMDGIDGIAGVQGFIAAMAWTLFGVWCDAPLTMAAGAVVAGGTLGFLFFNWSPAKIFMGDVGSAFLGYTFAVLPLLALKEKAVSENAALVSLIPLFSLLVVWPFVGDGFFTFVRRARQGEAVWKPHRSHLYQRLAQSGWTHAQVSTLYAAWCLSCALVAGGWLFSRGSVWAWIGSGAFILATLGAMLVFVTRREINRRSAHG